MREPRMRRWLLILAGIGLVAAQAAPSARAAPATPTFQVGAAAGDVDPPLYDRATNPAECDPTGTFGGPRQFNFEEPYKDTDSNGRYDYGEPYLDCDHNGRYDGIFITSGALQRPLILKDPIEARAFVVSNGRKTIAVEVIDSIGIFYPELDAIRARVQELVAARHLRHLDEIFISSTHDESAPDPVGLWGPASGVSGVDDYYMNFLAERGAAAIVQADASARPAYVRYAETEQPSRFQTCWSSYPYVNDRMVRILQAVDAVSLTPILTLSNYGIHVESMAFSPNPVENRYISADWVHFERAKLDADLGGIAIHMAGAVGSVETPRVFDSVTPYPTSVQHPDHPADCRTLDTGRGTLVPLGYSNETEAIGQTLATTVEHALATGAVWARGDEISFLRERFSVPLRNLLFAALSPTGLFAHRPGCVDDVQMPVLPNGTSAGTDACTEVAGYSIGDAEFMAVPGEVFPYVMIRGFQGPQDMPFPDEAMSPWAMPHASKPFRFTEGLGEDMIGYLFSQNDATGVPEAEPQRGAYFASGGDRFGCSHDDDSESTGGDSGSIVARHLIDALERLGTDPRQRVLAGRYVFRDGMLSRNPIGTGALRCDPSNDTFTLDPNGGAVAVKVFYPDGSSRMIVPAGFINSDGRPRAAPDMTTRGIWVPGAGETSFIEGVSKRIWLDVFPNLPGT